MQPGTEVKSAQMRTTLLTPENEIQGKKEKFPCWPEFMDASRIPAAPSVATCGWRANAIAGQRDKMSKHEQASPAFYHFASFSFHR